MEQATQDTMNEVIPFPSTPIALTPSAALNRAVALGATIEQMTELLALQKQLLALEVERMAIDERRQANGARKAYNNALAAAQGEIEIIRKTNKANFGTGKASYDFEDLASIIRVVRPVLHKYGLSHGYRTVGDGKEVIVACIISHADGHSEERAELMGPLDMSGNKNSLQALGSTVTYLERYTLKAALGLAAAKDDDGHGASSKPDAITPKQCADIELFAAEIGVPIKRVLDFCAARAGRQITLAELPASEFESVMNKLEATKRAKGEKR